MGSTGSAWTAGRRSRLPGCRRSQRASGAWRTSGYTRPGCGSAAAPPPSSSPRRRMPKTLVTGGTGFVGSAVVRLLAERGDELRLTTRRRSRIDHLADLDYEAVECDVLDRPAVRRAMRGVDRGFHAARLVSGRPDGSPRLF